MAVVFTDNFTRANETPLTTPYASVNNSLNLVSNRVRCTANDGGQDIARYGSFKIGDMRATITTANNDGNQIGCGVRCSSTALTLYTSVSAGNNLFLEKIIAGGFTTLGGPSGITPASTDTIGCDAQGSNLSTYYNGASTLGPVSDSAIASGTWAFRMSTTGTLANLEIDDASFETSEPFFVSAGTEGSAASGNITPGIPTGTNPHNLQANDILIMAYHGSDNVAVTVPAAWTAAVTQANGGSSASRMGVWWHRYDGSTSPSALITHAAGNGPIAGIAAFRNCKTSGSPVNAAGTIAGGTDATIEHTAISPTAAGLLLAINGAADDNDRTILSGYTSVFNEGAINAYLSTLGTPDSSVSMFFKPVASGSTGTVTVTQAAADPWAAVLVALEAGGLTAYTLDLLTGSYTLAGVNADLLATRLIDVATGSYSLGGLATILAKGYAMDVLSGSYTVTGRNGDLLAARVALAATGAYNISGLNALLVAGRTLDVATGSYSLNGLAAILAKGFAMDVLTGSYAIAGRNADLLAARVALAAIGAYNVTGRNADLFAARILNATPGSYVLGGLGTTILATRTLDAATGSYVITGKDALAQAQRMLEAGAGAYLITGRNADILAARSLQAIPGSYVISGVDVTLLYVPNVPITDFDLLAAPGVYAISGKDALLVAQRLLDGASGAYGITGKDASLTATRLLNATTGSYGITGKNADLLAGRIVNATPGVYNLSGRDASIMAAYILAANPGSYAIFGVDAILIESGGVGPSAGQPLITIINITDVTSLI